MEIYRNNARTVFNALKKEHPNAERQLSGYKQLQIHIHKGIREVDESLLVSPAEFKPPLMLVLMVTCSRIVVRTTFLVRCERF